METAVLELQAFSNCVYHFLPGNWIHEYASKRLMDVIKVICCYALNYRLYSLRLES